MKKAWLALALCLLLGASTPAQASNFYIMEDSGTRRMSEDELWTWQYDALGYALYEIYARHGYRFEAGSRYGQYFAMQEWYQEAEEDNAVILSGLSAVEKYNERAIKRVRAQMKEKGTDNAGGKGLPQISYSAAGDALSFTKMDVKAYRLLKVFSGPGTSYYRGANRRASASANGDIWVAGWDGQWLLIQYETNDGATRVGYVKREYVDNAYQLGAPKLSFDARTVTLLAPCEMTDDPKTSRNIIYTVPAGRKVTYLGSYACGDRQWAYIEARVDMQLARGFVPAEMVRLAQ